MTPFGTTNAAFLRGGANRPRPRVTPIPWVRVMYESENQPKPVLEPQENVLIINRPLYHGDVRRHFVGIVERYDGCAMRVRGYAFVHDLNHGGFIKRKSQRTRVFPLDNHVIVLVLPDDADLSEVRYEVSVESGLVITDKKHFKLDLNEFNG